MQKIFMVILMAALAVAAGILFSIQGPVNSTLGGITGKLEATTISFFGGVCVLAVVLLAGGSGDLRLIGQASPWQLLGGAIGAFSVFASIVCMPVLGAALTIMSVMLGQLVITACIDGFGLLGTEAIPVTPLRLAGIAVVALGIILVYLGNRKAGGKREKGSMAYVLFALVSGLINGTQSPINASLAGLIGSWESSFVSFFSGFVLALIATLIVSRGKFRSLRGTGAKPWMFLGGLLGVGGIFLNLTTVPALGAALQVVCCMVGQVGGALIIDSFGLLRAKKVKISPARGAGAAAIFLGVVLITLAKL